VTSGNDWNALETPGGRDDEGDPGRGGVSDPMLEEVSVASPVMTTCANSPWICKEFPSAFNRPGTISVASGGAEAVLFQAGRTDMVWIRTGDGIIAVATANLTNADQLYALVEQLVPRP
jgi:hypothetical protein